MLLVGILFIIIGLGFILFGVALMDNENLKNKKHKKFVKHGMVIRNGKLESQESYLDKWEVFKG